MIVVGFLVVLSFLVTVIALRLLPTDAHGATAIAVALLATDFVVRPFEFVVGLDTPFPDFVFDSQPTEAAMVRAQLLYLTWVVIFTGCSWLVHERLPSSRLITAPWLPADGSISAFLPVLGIIALGATAVLWARFGIGDLARIVKGSQVPVPTYFRSPSILLAYLGAALGGYGYNRNDRRLAWFGAAAFGFGAALAFTWGARDAAMLPLVVIVGAMVTNFGDRLRWVDRLRYAVLAMILVLFALGAGLGLRAVREYVAYGRTLEATTDGSIVRQVSVTTNHTRYDALLLVFDETDPTPERPGIGVFGDALRLAFTPSGTENSGIIVPSAAVRQTVQPSIKNGWPITAPGDWFYAGGWWAVPFGAALSGVAFGTIDRWRSAQKKRSWVASTAVVAIFATTVTWGGIGVTTPTRLRSLLVLGLLLLAAWNVMWTRLARE